MVNKALINFDISFTGSGQSIPFEYDLGKSPVMGFGQLKTAGKR